MMTLENAVARSISHNEIVDCQFAGDWKSLQAYVSDTFANGSDAVFSEENDGTIDIADFDGDWRVRVTFVTPAS